MLLLHKNAHTNSSAFSSKCNIKNKVTLASSKIESKMLSLTFIDSETIARNPEKYFNLYVNDQWDFDDISFRGLRNLQWYISQHKRRFSKDKLDAANFLANAYFDLQKLNITLQKWVDQSIEDSNFSSWTVAQLLQLYATVQSKQVHKKLKKTSLRKLKNILFKLRKDENILNDLEYVVLIELHDYVVSKKNMSTIKLEILQTSLKDLIFDTIAEFEVYKQIVLLNPFITLSELKNKK